MSHFQAPFLRSLDREAGKEKTEMYTMMTVHIISIISVYLSSKKRDKKEERYQNTTIIMINTDENGSRVGIVLVKGIKT